MNVNEENMAQLIYDFYDTNCKDMPKNSEELFNLIEKAYKAGSDYGLNSR